MRSTPAASAASRKFLRGDAVAFGEIPSCRAHGMHEVIGGVAARKGVLQALRIEDVGLDQGAALMPAPVPRPQLAQRAGGRADVVAAFQQERREPAAHVSGGSSDEYRAHVFSPGRDNPPVRE